jgi:hypothetical protein
MSLTPVKIKHSKKFYVFLLVYLIVGTYVFANVFDLQFWPFTYFNPPEVAPVFTRALDYPSYTLFNFRGPEIVRVQLMLNPSAPLAVGVSAEMTASGNINASYVNQISDVFAGFIGSSPYSFISKILILMVNYQFPFITLQPTHALVTYYYGVYIAGNSTTIVWDNQGDYAPVMVILFNNGTTITQTYPYLSVHVDSLDVARSERYNRVNEALSVALVLFGFVEGYGILHDIDEKNTRPNDSTKAPNPTGTGAATTSHSSYSRRNKARVRANKKRQSPKS